MALVNILDLLSLALDAIPSSERFGKAQRARFDRRFDEVCSVVGEQADAVLAAFCDDCKRLSAKRPNDGHILFRWGQALCRRAARAGREADQASLYEEADSKFSAAQVLEPNNGEICPERVDAQRRRALLSVGEDARRRLLEVCRLCGRLTGNNPTGPHEARTLRYWGLALASLAAIHSGEEAQRFYDEADDKLRRAYAISAEPEFIVDLTRVRLGRTMMHPAEARRDSLEQICAVLRDLTRRGKGGAAALAVWGKALGSMAWSSSDSDSERLYREAEEKLSRALHIMPEDAEIAAELLRVRGARALLLTGEARRNLMARVSEETERLGRRQAAGAGGARPA